MKASNLTAFCAGLVFSLGLLLSQMVDPEKVLNFLDFFGNWDPSLLLVMGAALMVYWLGFFLIKPKMSKPLFTTDFQLPGKSNLDKPLLTGAVLFGLGWGITGLCPGPALANIPGGEPKLLVFVTLMAATIWGFDKILSKKLAD